MGVAGVVGYSVWRITTKPNRNSAILAIHIPLNTAYVSVSTEPPDYNHVEGMQLKMDPRIFAGSPWRNPEHNQNTNSPGSRVENGARESCCKD